MDIIANKTVVEETSKVLVENQADWVRRFKRLAKGICRNEENYKAISKLFHTPGSIDTFTSMSRPGTNSIDLRFAGLSIGNIVANSKDDITLEVSERQAEYARKLRPAEYAWKLKYEKFQKFPPTEWHDKLPSNYRSFYKHQESTHAIKDTIKSLKEEVRIEHWILKEMKSHTNHLLRNISPILLCDHFFKMPVPINASNHTIPPEYLKSYGYMDIFASVKHGSNKDNRLAIIELKDENKDTESQCLALQQSLIYSTFIAHLLCSEIGDIWWNIFKNSKGTSIPKKEIKIDAVSLMPSDGNSCECKDFSPIPVSILGCDKKVTIYPYKLYYSKDSNQNPCKFKGTNDYNDSLDGSYNIVLP